MAFDKQDIGKQESQPYSYVAGSTISKGDCVEVQADGYIDTGDGSTGAFVGIADYDAVEGDDVAVWSHGVVWAKTSSSGATAGSYLTVGADGGVTDAVVGTDHVIGSCISVSGDNTEVFLF